MTYQEAINKWGRRLAEEAGRDPLTITYNSDVTFEIEHFKGYYWSEATWDSSSAIYKLTVPCAGGDWVKRWHDEDAFALVLREIVDATDETS